VIVWGEDAEGQFTQIISHISTLQITCKVIKVKPSTKKVKIGFILPEPARSPEK
jgi:hypothetical protein